MIMAIIKASSTVRLGRDDPPMSTTHRKHRSGRGRGAALALVPALPQPWYLTPPAIVDRQALEDEHTRILANAVGDHLPYELALRAAGGRRAAAALRVTDVAAARSRGGWGRARARRRVHRACVGESRRPPRRRTRAGRTRPPTAPSPRSCARATARRRCRRSRSPAVAAWRDELTAQGLSASTVAQRVSAVRRLAAAIGADPLVAQVRCTQVQPERPSALSDRELSALLARPDLRTTIGVRDRAILELLARAGLRRSELARLTLGRRPGAWPPTRRPPAHRDSSQARRPDPAGGRRARL